MEIQKQKCIVEILERRVASRRVGLLRPHVCPTRIDRDDIECVNVNARLRLRIWRHYCVTTVQTPICFTCFFLFPIFFFYFTFFSIFVLFLCVCIVFNGLKRLNAKKKQQKKKREKAFVKLIRFRLKINVIIIDEVIYSLYMIVFID